jgi:fibronectin-binding autotransporter adhesin
LSTGLTTLQITNNNGAPGAGSITVNYPAAGATGNANTLNLPGTSLPAGVTVNMTSLLSGAISLRTQITSSGTAAVNGPMTLSGSSIVQISPGSGVLSINGNVTEATLGGFTGTFFLRGAGNGVVNGTVNIPTGLFAKTDAAVWTINSTGNNWVSTAVVSSGSVILGVSNALPPTAQLIIGQASDNNSSLLNMNGFSQIVNGITWAAGTGSNARGISNATAIESVLTIDSASSNSFGSITGNAGGVITGNIRLVKQGTGSQTLGGANTYTGTTNITGGSLLVNGTHVGGGSYTVGATGTLGGSGTITMLASAINQVLISTGGTLAPGNSPGILSIVNTTPGTGAASTLSLASGSSMSVELNGLTAGTQYDRVNVTGTVDVSGASLAVSLGFTPALADEFIIVQNDGADAVTGTLFTAVNGSPLTNNGNGTWTTGTTDVNGVFYTVNYLGGDGNDVVLTGIPEPTGVALMAMAGLGLMSRRRRANSSYPRA